MGKSMVASKGRSKAIGKLLTKNQRGMATAEYAVGTLAAVSFGGVLVKIFTDPQFRKLLWDLLMWILGLIKPLVGA